MAQKPNVLLFGESVLMDSIAESLGERECSQVIRINSQAPKVRETVNSLNPDLIVYELDPQNTEAIFTIIREQADSIHLAIDLICKQVIVLDCHSKAAESMQELCDLVYQNVGHKGVIKEVH